jgi:hypothetical protein
MQFRDIPTGGLEGLMDARLSRHRRYTPGAGSAQRGAAEVQDVIVFGGGGVEVRIFKIVDPVSLRQKLVK